MFALSIMVLKVDWFLAGLKESAPRFFIFLEPIHLIFDPKNKTG